MTQDQFTKFSPITVAVKKNVRLLRLNADTEFVLVGAAHIVGENGLLDLPAQKGYEVN